MKLSKLTVGKVLQTILAPQITEAVVGQFANVIAYHVSRHGFAFSSRGLIQWGGSQQQRTTYLL